MKISSPYIIVFYAHFDGVCEKKKRKKKAAAFVKFINCGGVGVIMDL